MDAWLHEKEKRMSMNHCEDADELEGAAIFGLLDEAPSSQPPAWEQIEIGRYKPRRIRGSFRGGELG